MKSNITNLLRILPGLALALVLVVVLGFGVDRFLSGSQHTAVAPPAAGNHAVTHRHAGPGGPNPEPNDDAAAGRWSWFAGPLCHSASE